MSFYDHIDMLAEGGMLRRLGPVFARFVAALAPQGSAAAGTPLALACLLLSELEGRGHSCLQLSALAGDPSAMLGWSEDETRAILKGLNFAPSAKPRLGEPTAWRRRNEKPEPKVERPAAPSHSPFAALAVLHDKPAPARRPRRRRKPKQARA